MYVLHPLPIGWPFVLPAFCTVNGGVNCAGSANRVRVQGRQCLLEMFASLHTRAGMAVIFVSLTWVSFIDLIQLGRSSLVRGAPPRFYQVDLCADHCIAQLQLP